MNTEQKLLELQQAVKALLDKRSLTEWTYEEAYDFAFKSAGRDEWNKLHELIGWDKTQVPPELKEQYSQ